MEFDDITIITVAFSTLIIIGIITLLIPTSYVTDPGSSYPILPDATEDAPWSLSEGEVIVSQKDPSEIRLNFYNKGSRTILQGNTPKINCLINGNSVYFDTHGENEIVNPNEQVSYEFTVDSIDIKNSGTEKDTYYSCFLLICQDDELNARSPTECFNDKNIIAKKPFYMYVE